jgi:beta-lactamase superfamily II metal-dependent hydrolase
MGKLTIEMLPAREGDCLLLTYDDLADGRPRRVLIDAGRAGTYPALKKRLKAIPAGERELELFVITHIDRDHIEGALKVLRDEKLPVTFRDIWFNGYCHLFGPNEAFGAVMGEGLTTELSKPTRSWNADFAGKAVCIADDGTLPPISLRGGLKLTLLSPDFPKLEALRPVWEKECEEAGITAKKTKRKLPENEEAFGLLNVEHLAAAPFKGDTAEANGSSIGLLAEYGTKKVLLGADCHPDRLLTSLEALSPNGPLPLDAFKLPHHGSSANISREILERVRCSKYLVSTNGSYFQHPTREAVARVLKWGGPSKELHFNYKSDFTTVWASKALRAKWGYEAFFPASEAEDGNLSVVV